MNAILNDLETENRKLKQQLQALKQEAQQNEFLLRQTQTRQLEFLKAESLPDLLRILLTRLRDVYKLHHVTLVYEDKEGNLPELLERHHLSMQDYPNLLVTENLKKYSQTIEKIHAPYLNTYTEKTAPFFVNENVEQDVVMENIQSVAILPLIRHSKKIGYLNFASNDSGRFFPGLGTEFLEQMATIISFCLENVINRERLVLTGLTDVLTGWPNRRYLHQRMQEELARVQRKQAPISCILFDIDHFKKINDTFGHPAGDSVLRQLSQRVRSALRYGDIAARYGGEEFIIALPDVKLSAAAQFAERVRSLIEDDYFTLDDGRLIKVTISVGVACLAPEWSAKSMTYLMGELIAQADRHLYFAKSNGRNQVAY
ncbi:MAG: sensor domain-containing diguanylate cyclase [Gammaproteobacteria bacterium]|nr:DUF484 family protein [Gammaproteobacteria bacterium]NNC97814.1 sensor domain-containing diguanylate cyclase [Gammaproteobacteria bacterium]NNM13843.1 sensor domain-containing diguanylate cyclase [Gammaproteobacteria bacterium]